MCAQFVQPSSVEDIAEHFQAEMPEEPLSHHTMMFPKYTGLVIYLKEGVPTLKHMEWGLLPQSAKDRSLSKRYATFNARSESLETSRLYAPVFNHHQTCLIPTSSFFEWSAHEGKKKRVEIKKRRDPLFAIAGLWNFSPHVEEAPLWSFTMLTAQAGKSIYPFHGRMPVVLEEEEWKPWLFGESDLKEITETARGISFEVQNENRGFKEDILHSP